MVLFRCLEQILWEPANRSNLVCVHAAVGASVVEFRHGDDLLVCIYTGGVRKARRQTIPTSPGLKQSWFQPFPLGDGNCFYD